MIYIPKELTQMMPLQHRHKPQFMQSADPAVDVKMSKNITNTRILANFTSIFHSGEQNFRPNTGGGHKKRKKNRQIFGKLACGLLHNGSSRRYDNGKLKSKSILEQAAEQNK
jgi:hypothetical protein